jgi:hypothetical protein
VGDAKMWQAMCYPWTKICRVGGQDLDKVRTVNFKLNSVYKKQISKVVLISEFKSSYTYGRMLNSVSLVTNPELWDCP